MLSAHRLLKARPLLPVHYRLSSSALKTGFCSQEPVFNAKRKIPAQKIPFEFDQVVTLARGAFTTVDQVLSNDKPLFNCATLRCLETTLDPVLEACRAFEAQNDVTSDDVSLLRKSVRAIARDLVQKGPFGREIVMWPRGPGSSTAMQIVYEGLNLPTYSVKAHYMDWYLRNADLAHAVRSRKDTLRDLLLSEVSSCDSTETIDILDLANGPIQSLKELLMSEKLAESLIEQIRYKGYDTDGKTQQANKEWIEEFGSPIAPNSFAFEEANACTAPFKSDCQYNAIYSTGFFDYLPDSKLVTLWQDSFNALKPGGVLLISLKDGNRYNAQLYHYFMKWDHFIQRSKEHFEGLLENSGMPSPEQTVRDATGIILFYIIRKPADKL